MAANERGAEAVTEFILSVAEKINASGEPLAYKEG
jgi:hypothetical protein